ncbi:hypothetical protein BHM03_00005315, partial [Ensete ventricosum]
VGNLTVSRLCEDRVITAVNGQLPGPTIECPIRPGNSYTYKFNVTGQEGTLWWHAHVSFLRATVHGALIIRPRGGPARCPFPQPDHEIPIVLALLVLQSSAGEWWKANVVDVADEAFLTGGNPNISDAFTINGRPGDSYECSKKRE